MNLKKIKSYMINYYSDYINQCVEKYQKIYKFNMIYEGDYRSYNNEADAFKHTFMQADLTLRFNEIISKLVGDDHENRPNNDPNEMNMDLWNNAQGREIGTKIKSKYNPLNSKVFNLLANSGFFNDIIAEEVMIKMKNNQLITDPYNPMGKYYQEEIPETPTPPASENTYGKILYMITTVLYRHRIRPEFSYIGRRDTLLDVLKTVAKFTNMKTSDLVNIIVETIKELDAKNEREYLKKRYINKNKLSWGQPNIKRQNTLNYTSQQNTIYPYANNQINEPLFPVMPKMQPNQNNNISFSDEPKVTNDVNYTQKEITPKTYLTNNNMNTDIINNNPIPQVQYNMPTFENIQNPIQIEENPITPLRLSQMPSQNINTNFNQGIDNDLAIYTIQKMINNTMDRVREKKAQKNTNNTNPETGQNDAA